MCEFVTKIKKRSGLKFEAGALLHSYYFDVFGVRSSTTPQTLRYNIPSAPIPTFASEIVVRVPLVHLRDKALNTFLAQYRHGKENFTVIAYSFCVKYQLKNYREYTEHEYRIKSSKRS